jgi:uncharacterized protein
MTMLFLAIGVGAGVLSGLFGIGGGLIIVPALAFLAGKPILAATGTSLGALLLPVGLLGAIEYHRNGNLDIRASMLIALGLFIGVWFGAHLAHAITAVQLKRAFAVFLILVAARMWLSATE